MARRKKNYTPVAQAKTVKKPEYRTLDVYQGGRTVEQLQEIRRVLAKQANQRIVRLERAKSSITGESFNEFGAITDVYDYLNYRDRHRFSESKKALNDLSSLKHEITVLQGFLGRKSSTVKGMRDIEKSRIKTFESKGITFANTKEFYDFLNSQTFHNLVSAGFSSEQIVEAYQQAREKTSDKEAIKKMEKALEQFRDGDMKVNLKNLESILDVNLIDRG